MIYSIGEMIIDFMQEGNNFVPYPGGAPANVAIHAKKPGAQAYFVGKLSNDNFGTQLKSFLHDNDVYYDLALSEKSTTLAMVSHDQGERSFRFYRDNTADLDLSVNDIDTIPFKKDDILHFCSLGLVDDGTTYEAHLHAIHSCKELGGYISFDVNLRPLLWKDLELAKSKTLKLIDECDIVKVNEEELYWLTGTTDVEEGLNKLQTKAQVVICTQGDKGPVVLKTDGTYISKKVPVVEQVDTTGAGDSFTAMILSSLSKSLLSFDQWQKDELKHAVEHATLISAQVVTYKGAIPDISY